MCMCVCLFQAEHMTSEGVPVRVVDWGWKRSLIFKVTSSYLWQFVVISSIGKSKNAIHGCFPEQLVVYCTILFLFLMYHSMDLATLKIWNLARPWSGVLVGWVKPSHGVMVSSTIFDQTISNKTKANSLSSSKASIVLHWLCRLVVPRLGRGNNGSAQSALPIVPHVPSNSHFTSLSPREHLLRGESLIGV